MRAPLPVEDRSQWLTAEQLGLSDKFLEALDHTLMLLETGQVPYAPPRSFKKYGGAGGFNMRAIESGNCGTVHCILGMCEVYQRERWPHGFSVLDRPSLMSELGPFRSDVYPEKDDGARKMRALHDLFCPPGWRNGLHRVWDAVAALKSYRATGTAVWPRNLSTTDWLRHGSDYHNQNATDADLGGERDQSAAADGQVDGGYCLVDS